MGTVFLKNLTLKYNFLKQNLLACYIQVCCSYQNHLNDLHIFNNSIIFRSKSWISIPECSVVQIPSQHFIFIFLYTIIKILPAPLLQRCAHRRLKLISKKGIYCTFGHCPGKPMESAIYGLEHVYCLKAHNIFSWVACCLRLNPG